MCVEQVRGAVEGVWAQLAALLTASAAGGAAAGSGGVVVAGGGCAEVRQRALIGPE